MNVFLKTWTDVISYHGHSYMSLTHLPGEMFTALIQTQQPSRRTVSEILNLQYNFKSLRYTETVNLTLNCIFICQLIAFKQHQLCLCFKQFMMYKQSSTYHLLLRHTHNHMRCKWTQWRQIAVGSKQAGLVWPADMLRAGIGGSVWAEHLSPLSTVRRAHTGLTADLQLLERCLSHPGALCMATYIFA